MRSHSVKLTGAIEQEHLAVEGGASGNRLSSLEGAGSGNSWENRLETSTSTSAASCSGRGRRSGGRSRRRSSSGLFHRGFWGLGSLGSLRLLGSIDTGGDGESHEGKL